MNFVEIVFVLSFIETFILFLYAIRWYIFSFVSHRAKNFENAEKIENTANSSFVSILLPIYNEVNVVDRLLNACTSFESSSYEVIIVDDSNDKETIEKLGNWEKNPKVKLIHRDDRKGWKGGALNVAIDHLDSKSTHVLIFDADFVPPKDLINRFLSRFENTTIEIVQGYQRHNLNAEENWITKGVRVWTSLYNMVELNGQQQVGLFSPLTGCVFMIKSELLKQLRFEEVTDEDWNLTMRLYLKGHKIVYDPSLMASGECPSTIKRLFRQQSRWAEGHTRTFRSNFLKIWRCKFLNLKEKLDFTFIGASFLNSVLVVILTFAGLITLFYPSVYFPQSIVQISSLLLFASIPAAIISSFVALSLENSKKDYGKIGYAWLLNFIVTPVLAFSALKGFITKKGFFHRTHKTGKIINKK